MDFQLDRKLNADCIQLGDLKLCRLLLMNDRNYPWLILVPRKPQLKEIFQLERDDQISYMIESNLIARMLSEVFQAEKLNIAALGNVVSQLHIHHIARFTNDPAWPRPVWGQVPCEPYSAAEVATIVGRTKDFLGKNLREIPAIPPS